MKRVLLPLVVIAAVLTLACAASAQTYSGTIAVGSCISAGGVWAQNPGTLSWTVSRDPVNNWWNYQYTLNVGSQGDISHFILELTPGVTLNDLFAFNWPAVDLEVNTFNAAGPGESNPGLPCPIYGIKFDDADALVETFAFRSFIEPTWGDFYAKNGQSGALGDNFMYNTTICLADPVAPPANGANNCKILRPEGDAIIIPEPGSMALAVMGLLPALGYGIRRRRS